MRKNKSLGRTDFWEGFRDGIPIALGYISVSFAFGIMVTRNGLPPWIALLISMSNLTSAGQFAGTGLLLAGAGILEIAVTVFIVNIRYSLMSFSLTQKIAKKTTFFERCLISFGITDEVFAIASQRPQHIKPAYMGGLIFGPFWGWSLGTLLGATAGSLLPPAWLSALGVALYAMFIAIVTPSAKRFVPVCAVAFAAIALSCLLRYTPGLSRISGGWRMILCALIASGIGARCWPVSEEGGQA
jgi:predicted branched-subunit amino acid permease